MTVRYVVRNNVEVWDTKTEKKLKEHPAYWAARFHADKLNHGKATLPFNRFPITGPDG